MDGVGLSDEMFRYLVEAVEDYSIYFLTPDGVVASWNAGAERVKGYAPEEIVGSHFSRFFTDDDRLAGVPDALLRQAREAGRMTTEGWRVKKGGATFWADVVIHAVHDQKSGEFLGFAKITRDVTTARESTAALHRAATTDSLTGLLNRPAFFATLGRWAEQGAEFAVAIIDLNDFKQINDSRGHSVGDAVLVGCARNMQSHADESTVFARLGGDEFAAAALSLAGRTPEDFAEALTQIVAAPIESNGERLHIKGSVGVSTSPSNGRDASELVLKADAAMYDAKERQLAGAVFYSEGLLLRANSRRLLGLHIRDALDRGEFALVYQPQAALGSSSVVGYEALIRWNHPELGVLDAGEFIPLAEANGTIVPLGAWALQQACRDAAGWRSEARVAVNVSATQLVSEGFVDDVRAALDASGLAPGRLEVEITESTFIRHKSAVIEKLRTLHGDGVLIALDDFGTGFSSLDTLLTFPFDRVKIDRAILHETLYPARSKEVLRAILALGHALTASVLVEGVETEEQRDLLRLEGFDEVQGFLIGPPRPSGH
ncbi:MAG: bifunctional diguanylate cyclase/phosphodiesterase [Herbiconiux sp.]|nr:bifunctional diguanylate cyclase/phosphodiesterase [Herbiconiux sp.]